MLVFGDIHGIANVSLAIIMRAVATLACFLCRSSQSECHEPFPFSSHRTWCMVPRRMGAMGAGEGQETDVDLFRIESKSSFFFKFACLRD